MQSDHTKVLAFYLPQFHPIPENNQWWGPGFTEWTNVASAQPRFKGHYQPHLPADLGFYDLRLEETRVAQAKLAQSHGLTGFCYYHYWFDGKRLLQRPFDEVLQSKRPDFPFCLCWANENWTRAWDGLQHQILIRQTYSAEDSFRHIEWLIKAFQDERYIKIQGRPLFLIYRLDAISDAKAMILVWREAIRKAGFSDIYLCAVKNGFCKLLDEEILQLGIDGIVDFQPNRLDFPMSAGLKSRTFRMARQLLPESIYQRLKLSVSTCNVIDYPKMVDEILQKPWPEDYRKFPCVFPSWDNSARRRSATVIQNTKPSLYGNWLSRAIENVSSYTGGEQIVFINAWNEWAEGCHLEPDLLHGRAFLEATLEAVERSQARRT